MDDQTKEILTILQEEAAEVIVEVSKCFRFGPDQMLTGTDTTNIQRLEKEIGDIEAMIELLIKQDIGISSEGINNAKLNKFDKLKRFSNIEIK